ncbi:penicillin acylase family protein [Fulvivirga sp. M361]|uniref:penicillin acylase family protein n=1 Tax=Fulvivirga sp. M361 TaxID=2594266 RepID=UPI00162495DD|nr:penicillin acylase family protein [Fulvivirga sp. M361]
MKIIKFSISVVITLALIYFLNNRLVIQGNPVPPLGKFLDPFHGFWQNAESDSIPFAPLSELTTLKDSVNVFYDKYGIPHIFAQNDHDLFMAQGFVVAQNRLWQMDFQSYAAAGRISELIGEAALDFDRLQRRKGMVSGARTSLETMLKNTQLKLFLEAYQTGVNTFISSLKYKNLPLEYKILDYEPEPWTPLKSALLLQYMNDNLTGWDRDLQNTNAYLTLGEERFKALFPQWPAGIDPVVQSPEQWSFEAAPKEKPDSLIVSNTMMKKVHPMPDPDNGSNNWAVAGWKTKSGKAILASDMHLGLNAPSLWFLMQLSSPNYNVMGFALTGNVGIVSGFNENIAWSFTDVSRDERDWYSIKFKEGSRSEYFYGDKTLPVETSYEEIKIRDSTPYTDTILTTVHGPIVYDDSFLSDGQKDYLALKWIGHTPSRVQDALIDLNRASNYNEYTEALRKWDAPSQHVAFASDQADVAIRVQGLLPNRFKGHGRFIMDGSDPAFDWGEFIPFEHYAFEHNPPRGFISSANQHSVDQKYPYEMNLHNSEFYRNRRINNQLNAFDSSSITPQDMMKLQNDAYGIKPSEILPVFLDSIDKSKNSEFMTALKEWDYFYTVPSKAPTYFEVWWRSFRNLLWDEFIDSELPMGRPSDYHTIWMLKNDFPKEFYDHQGTSQVESFKELLSMSLDSAKTKIQTWEDKKGLEATWGNYKGTSIIHLSRIPAFGTYNIQVDGQSKTINSTKPNHGPSQRLVVEMTSPPQAWVVLPGGQSGNPGNPLYENMIPLWRDGEYIKLNFMQNETSENEIFFKQTLTK